MKDWKRNKVTLLQSNPSICCTVSPATAPKFDYAQSVTRCCSVALGCRIHREMEKYLKVPKRMNLSSQICSKFNVEVAKLKSVVWGSEASEFPQLDWINHINYSCIFYSIRSFCPNFLIGGFNNTNQFNSNMILMVNLSFAMFTRGLF